LALDEAGFDVAMQEQKRSAASDFNWRLVCIDSWKRHCGIRSKWRDVKISRIRKVDSKDGVLYKSLLITVRFIQKEERSGR
jgi:hypothetical protein